MISNFLENPFAKSRISNQEFGLLALSHLSFLQAQNTNDAYTPLIERLTPVSDNYRLWLAKQQTTKTTKKGKTLSLNDVFETVEVFIDDLHDEIINWKRTKPEMYNAFFPNGKSEYKPLNRTSAESTLERLYDACLKNRLLDKSFTDRALVILNNFKAQRGQQLEKKGEVKEISDDGRALRSELAHIMYAILLDLTKMHLADTSKVKTFYDAHFINPKPAKKVPKVVPKE